MLIQIRSLLQRAGLLEAAVLASLLLIAGSVLLFAETADRVVEGESQHLDERVLQALRDPDGSPIGPVWLVHVARDLTALGSGSVISVVCLCTVGLLVMRRRWASVLLVLAAIAGGGYVSTLLKRAFDRPRPDLSLHLAEVSSLSFPSGHSMLAAATYFTLAALLGRTTADRRIKIYILSTAAILVLIIGATRIYLGVHYPTDVLAGWCAGLAWALMCNLVTRWLQRRGAVEKEAPARVEG